MVAAALPPTAARAQLPEAWARVAGRAVATVTAAAPVPRGGTLTEARIVQPVAMLHAGAFHDRLHFVATANLEGLTISNGELAPGAWGEGFVDRRHPHTYLHELMLVAGAPVGPARLSVAAGKGFVPFGTDDPMVRPAVRYPVNHHLSQILERAVAIGAARAGPVLVEGALFNGDEPTEPRQWPLLDRWGDSWAARVTLVARSAGADVEIQASHAHVHSPEHRPGAGPDQEKWSAAVRSTGSVRGALGYASAEWARTSEAAGFFLYHSVLAEAALSVGPHTGYVRAERTERPEETRDSDFRTVRPRRDDAVIGVSRWTLVTLGYQFTAFRAGGLALRPFAEGTLGHVAKVGSGLFDPAVYYGSESVRAITIGLRVAAGAGDTRMGRYADLAADRHGAH